MQAIAATAYRNLCRGWTALIANQQGGWHTLTCPNPSGKGLRYPPSYKSAQSSTFFPSIPPSSDRRSGRRSHPRWDESLLFSVYRPVSLLSFLSVSTFDLELEISDSAGSDCPLCSSCCLFICCFLVMGEIGWSNDWSTVSIIVIVCFSRFLNLDVFGLFWFCVVYMERDITEISIHGWIRAGFFL